MKPLTLAQKLLPWICMAPLDDSMSKSKKFGYLVFNIFFLTTQISVSAAGMAFVWKYLSIDLEGSVFAFAMTFGVMSVTYMMIVLLCSQRKITTIFKQLKEIYDSNEKEDSFKFLVEANDKSQRYWTIFVKYFLPGIIVNFGVNSMVSILLCLYKYGRLEREHLFIPFNYVLPWDPNTTFGYLGELFFCTFSSVAFSVINGSILLLFVAMCLNHQAFYERYHHSTLKIVNPANKTRTDREILCDMIRFQNSIKRWFILTADLYSFIIFFEMVYSMFDLACALFILELKLNDPDFGICIIMLVMLSTAGNLYMFCLFGKLATDSYAKMPRSLFESNWLALPVDLQKFFILMIGNSHRRIFYHGFGFIILDLETFSRFIKLVFTYYMLFKTITSN